MSLRMSFLPVRWKGNRAQDFLRKRIKMQHPETPSPVGEEDKQEEERVISNK